MKLFRYFSTLAFLLMPVSAFADHGHNGYNKQHAWSSYNRPYNGGSPYSRPYNGWNSYGYSKNYSYNEYSPSDSYFYNGIRSGELSRREIEELSRNKQNIRDEERRYWADGYLTRNERIDLYKDTQAYKDQLYHELHDGEHRY